MLKVVISSKSDINSVGLYFSGCQKEPQRERIWKNYNGENRGICCKVRLMKEL